MWFILAIKSYVIHSPRLMTAPSNVFAKNRRISACPTPLGTFFNGDFLWFQQNYSKCSGFSRFKKCTRRRGERSELFPDSSHRAKRVLGKKLEVGGADFDDFQGCQGYWQ